MLHYTANRGRFFEALFELVTPNMFVPKKVQLTLFCRVEKESYWFVAADGIHFGLTFIPVCKLTFRPSSTKAKAHFSLCWKYDALDNTMCHTGIMILILLASCSKTSH